MIEFHLPDHDEPLVKMGMSRRPSNRLQHQFDLADGVSGKFIDKIPLPTGIAALRHEKRMHANLRASRPDLVVGRDELNWIRVVSEIYRAEALPLIQSMMDEVRQQLD